MNEMAGVGSAGVEWAGYLQAVFALALVAALIVLSGALARKYGLDRRFAGARAGKTSRLTVEDTLYLDPRRRLVLVRCDAREHLLLLGATQDVVVDTHDAPAREATHAQT